MGMEGFGGGAPAQEESADTQREARIAQLGREIEEVREAVVHLSKTEGFLSGNDSDIRIHAEAQQRLMGMENELMELKKS